jgi:hypothetical protein
VLERGSITVPKGSGGEEQTGANEDGERSGEAGLTVALVGDSREEVDGTGADARVSQIPRVPH